MARTSSSDDSSSEDEIAARIKSVAVSAADISASAVASQELANALHARLDAELEEVEVALPEAPPRPAQKDAAAGTKKKGKKEKKKSKEVTGKLEEEPEAPADATALDDDEAPFQLFTRIVTTKRAAAAAADTEAETKRKAEAKRAALRAREAPLGPDAWAQLARAREAAEQVHPGRLGPTRWPHEATCACAGSGKAHVRAVLARVARGEKVACPHLEYLGYTSAGVPRFKRAEPPAQPISSNPKSVKRRLKRAAERAARRAAEAAEAPEQPSILQATD
ncbi:hypothetical protein QBZ16_001263 [Prototheca wickerhamii]|uniref:Uncharacterized protein n=1 Tax=Prototheca wickerhamii TaxID=3111 RepID=A0AAD9IGW3_PROWI|nr:hypothetical protein QBZ16_001263 [Prototheca wickerhamii]